MSAAQDDAHGRIAALVLAKLGAEVAALDDIEPGLGLRRFYRVHLRGKDATPPAIIARVEAPDDPERRPRGVGPEPSLEPLRTFLAESGLPVPASFGHDAEAGIDLLEDLGSESLEERVRVAPPDERRSLYREACALVPRLQALDAPRDRIPAFGRRLDERLIAHKAELLLRWGLPWALGREPDAAETKTVREGFSRIADACRAAPGRLAHRDMKAANLHLRPGAAEGERLVLIDLQGAFLAPPEYDLVCLLHDAHVALPVSEVDALLAEIRPALPDAPDVDTFARRFHLLTLSRVSKDLSAYLHAWRARGDDRYLPFVPRAAQILRRSAARIVRLDAAMAPLAELLGRLPEGPCEP